MIEISGWFDNFRIKSHYTGEPGKGKTQLDGHFGTAANKCKQSLATGVHDNVNAATLLGAHEHNGGMEATWAKELVTNRVHGQVAKPKSSALPGIRSYSFRDFVWDPKVKGREGFIELKLHLQSRNGTGLRIPNSKIQQSWEGPKPQGPTKVVSLFAKAPTSGTRTRQPKPSTAVPSGTEPRTRSGAPEEPSTEVPSNTQTGAPPRGAAEPSVGVHSSAEPGAPPPEACIEVPSISQLGGPLERSTVVHSNAEPTAPDAMHLSADPGGPPGESLHVLHCTPLPSTPSTTVQENVEHARPPKPPLSDVEPPPSCEATSSGLGQEQAAPVSKKVKIRAKRLERVHGKGKTSTQFKVGQAQVDEERDKEKKRSNLAKRKKKQISTDIEQDKAAKRKRGVLFCSEHADGNVHCTLEYFQSRSLLNHVRAAAIDPRKHSCGTRGMTKRSDSTRKANAPTLSTQDALKTMFAAQSTGANAVARDHKLQNTTPLQQTSEYTVLGTGKLVTLPILPAGYASKAKRSGRKRYTEAQLKFLKWCYEQGVMEKAKKITSESAEKLMEMHGTTAGHARFLEDEYWKPNEGGKPTFGVRELMDTYTIKPWFSRHKGMFDKQLAKALQERTQQVTDDDATNEEEDDLGASDDE